MRLKRIAAAVLASAISITAFPILGSATVDSAPTGFYLNMLSAPGGADYGTYSDDKIDIDINSARINLKNDIRLYGTDFSGSYGVPIVAKGGKSYTIHLEDGVNAVLDATNTGKQDYIYGLNLLGNVKIEGHGTLRIISGNGAKESAAIRNYTSGAELTIDGAHVIAEDANGYGIFDDNDSIKLINGAVLEVSGGSAALRKKISTGNLLVSAGSCAADADDWDGKTDLSSYKYIKLEARYNNDADAYAVLSNSSSAVCRRMTAEMPSGKPVIRNQSGRDGWFLEPDMYTSSYIRCNIDDALMHELDGSCSAVVAVDYFDGDTKGGFGLYYDSRTGPKTEFVQLEGTSEWKTKVFRLYDAYFGGGAMTDDFRIVTNHSGEMGKSNAHVLISGIYVSKEHDAAPFNIEAVSNELGNMFFEGYSVKFNIAYSNVGNRAYDFTTDYIIKNYAGEVKYRESRKLSANPSVNDTLDIGALPFGVYTLTVYVHGSGITQKYITDLSYLRSADRTNQNVGINTHFDDALYTETEIRKQARMIWYAGFGFVRSPVRWHSVETKKGQYSIPANVKAADDFLSEKTDIKTLAIVYNENNLYDTPPYYLESDEKKAAFKAYCKYVAENLHTDYFAMLNEFNHNSSGYIDNQDKYISIARAGYDGIKSVKPNSWINLGSLAGASRYWDNTNAHTEIKKELLSYGNSFSWHIYAHTSAPENEYFARSKNLKTFLKNLDSTKAAWTTESGWPTRTANNKENESVSQWIADAHDSSSELEQAKWYVRSMALHADKERTDKFFLYNLMDTGVDYFNIQANFGIIHAKKYRTPFAAKPAFATAAAFNDITNGSAYVENVINDGSGYGYRFANDVICLWSEEKQSGGRYTYTTTHPYIVVYDMYGNASYHNTSSYTVSYGPDPIYISWSDSMPGNRELNRAEVSATPQPTDRETPKPIPEWVPQDGIIWSDDFSSAAVYDWNNANLNAMKTANGGKYNNIFGVSIEPAKGCGRVLKQSTEGESGFYIYNKELYNLGRHEDISSGTLLLSQDVYIPAGSGTSGGAYLETWSASRLNGNLSYGGANIFSVSSDKNNASVSFQTDILAAGEIKAGSDNTAKLAFDQWHRLETVISYEAGTVEYYADGKRICIYQGTPNNIMTYFPVAYFGLRTDAAQAGEDAMVLLWDNFCIRSIDNDFTPSMTKPIAEDEYRLTGTLIDMNFDNINLPDDSSGFTDFRLVHQASLSDNSFVGDPRWTSYYTKLVDDNSGGKMLQYNHFLDWNQYYRNGLKFPFRDSAGNTVTVDGGLLIVEFDAGVSGRVGRSRVLFGLNDPQKRECDWTPATVFGGIMPYNNSKLSFTAAMPDYRNKFKSDSGMDNTMAFTTHGEMHHYQFIIDIDRMRYKLYYDDILVSDCVYFPGNAQDNSFDSFMMTGVNAVPVNGDMGNTYFLLDNLRVKSAERPNQLAAETKYLGSFRDDEYASEKTGAASGYFTTITGSGTADTIYWRIRTGSGEVRNLYPASQLGEITPNGGSISITVMVDGLTDENAEVKAVIY